MIDKEIRELPDWLVIIQIKACRDILEKQGLRPEESKILVDKINIYKKELVRRRDILTAVIDEKYD